MPSTLQSIPGIAGLRRSFPSSVLIVGPRKRLKASPPAASAIASCRSRLRPWLVSIDDENLVSVTTVGVVSDAKDILSALKLATKNKAVRIEVARYICFLKPKKGQRSWQRSRSGIGRDAFRVLAGDVRLASG